LFILTILTIGTWIKLKCLSRKEADKEEFFSDRWGRGGAESVSTRSGGQARGCIRRRDPCWY